MKPKEKKVKKKNDLVSLNVDNPVTPNDAYNVTPCSYTTIPSDVTAANDAYPTTLSYAAAAAAAIPSTAVTPIDAYTPSDAAAATIASTAVTPTDTYTTTPSDTAATATIASTAFPGTIAIAITGQKTAVAALVAAAIAAKTIQFPTTMFANINDKGNAAIKITQDQATEIYRIQEMLDKYGTSIVGMCSYLQKLATTYVVPSTEDNGDDIDTSKAKPPTFKVVCPSTITGEESIRYISSSLKTTKPVPLDKEGTTTQVGKVPLMAQTNPDAHTDPAFTDPALLIKKMIILKDYSKVKKKKKMNLVQFKKDERFWTIDEVEEDADKEDNDDDFSFCTDAAGSDAYTDVMSSFLDVTKRSLSLSMPLSDGTKP